MILNPGQLRDTLIIRRHTQESTDAGPTETPKLIAKVAADVREPAADQVEAAGGILPDADLVALVRWDPDIRENDVAGWLQADGKTEVQYRILSARDPDGQRHVMRLFMAVAP